MFSKPPISRRALLRSSLSLAALPLLGAPGKRALGVQLYTVRGTLMKDSDHVLKTIAAIGHTEYHGWSFPGECHSQNIFLCEFDSDTFHISYDGGYHFDQSKAPENVIAGLPYKYAIDRGPMGYSVDTNIIEWNGWFYARPSWGLWI